MPVAPVKRRSPSPVGCGYFWKFIFFGGGTWMLFDAGNFTAGWVFGVVLVIHYIVSYDRIIWMLRGRQHPI